MKRKLNISLFVGMALITVMLTGGLSEVLDARVYAAAIPASGQQELAQVKLISINKADSIELQTVRGIGPVIAGKILQYRKEHGSFEHVEDLAKVPGLGKAKFEKIKTQISI
ncbi:MAG: helix-hairpin-helix domain-containing protein [Candidatus Omnitrophica bacterium]|nr:helix-hairpin-helix domain-containing protein [Candidatus Omnitrophota bacterium]